MNNDGQTDLGKHIIIVMDELSKKDLFRSDIATDCQWRKPMLYYTYSEAAFSMARRSRQ